MVVDLLRPSRFPTGACGRTQKRAEVYQSPPDKSSGNFGLPVSRAKGAYGRRAERLGARVLAGLLLDALDLPVLEVDRRVAAEERDRDREAALVRVHHLHRAGARHERSVDDLDLLAGFERDLLPGFVLRRGGDGADVIYIYILTYWLCF